MIRHALAVSAVALFLVFTGCSSSGSSAVMDSIADDAAGDGALTKDTVEGDSTCTPQCAGRECGSDGCGGTCGSCPQVAPVCNAMGLCEVQCIPTCEGKECGDDGCGGDCGSCPQVAPYCVDNICAVECTPSCEGKECGDDGCNGNCGECTGNDVCIDGSCQCSPDCTGKECGSDGCGGSCGECPMEAPFCKLGSCTDDCTPDCTGKECGDDGCGGSCGDCDVGDCIDGICACVPNCPDGACGDDGCGGDCGECHCDERCVDGWCNFVGCGQKECGVDGCGESCGDCPPGSVCSAAGQCLNSCEAACLGKECGSDGCGGTCGSCAPSQFCTDAGECVDACTPDCVGRQCGSDGCGGSCGTCTLFDVGPYCLDGQCVAECQPQCGSKVCGPDGCGGSCGSCEPGVLCTVGGTCGSACAQCGYQQSCLDTTFVEGNLGDWSVTEGALLVDQFAESTAPTGGHMLFLTTGSELVQTGSSATWQDCLPAGSYMMVVSWQLYSTELMEFCNSAFMDRWSVDLVSNGQTQSLISYTVQDICPTTVECPDCGQLGTELFPSDEPLDQGGVFRTEWLESWAPVTVGLGTSPFDLVFSVEDVGDSVFDTVVLVDRIRFVDCENACEFIECGTNPCGADCGACAQGGVCQAGSCCYPSCDGKECGNDGCGGSCGTCGSLTTCQANQCVCKFEQCSDGCCVSGEVCSLSSGKCCEPDCSGNPCGPDGCGGTCPALGGATCCENDSDCDDGDDLCTIDECLDGVCHFVSSGNPQCCQPYEWSQTFEDGSSSGFTFVNSAGGGLPGMEAGWSVSDACGAYSGSWSLYFGMTQSLLGVCLYNFGFPVPISTYGTATTEVLTLPDTTTQMTYWIQADVQAEANVDLFEMRVLSGGQSTTLLTKADLPEGTGAVWQSITVDLSNWAGQSIQIQFSFDTVTADQAATGKGILIDDVSIQSACSAL